MLDIVFGDSACGSLKLAQSYGSGAYRGGAVSVIISHRDGAPATPEETATAQKEAEARALRDWEQAKPMGGNPADVFGFGLGLDMGDIAGADAAGEAFWAGRRQVLERLYSVYLEGPAAAAELCCHARETLQTVMDRAAVGEDLRLWTCDEPGERCGAAWLLAVLQNRLPAYSGRVWLAELPRTELCADGTALQYGGWGDVAPGQWHRFLPLVQKLPPVLRRVWASEWLAVQAQDAPLRAVVNGRLQSVPQTMYDPLLRAALAEMETEFSEAVLIGTVLGQYRPGVGDAWLALRVQAMVEAGELTPVTEAPAGGPSYRRILRKVDA